MTAVCSEQTRQRTFALEQNGGRHFRLLPTT